MLKSRQEQRRITVIFTKTIDRSSVKRPCDNQLSLCVKDKALNVARRPQIQTATFAGEGGMISGADGPAGCATDG